MLNNIKNFLFEIKRKDETKAFWLVSFSVIFTVMVIMYLVVNGCLK